MNILLISGVLSDLTRALHCCLNCASLKKSFLERYPVLLTSTRISTYPDFLVNQLNEHLGRKNPFGMVKKLLGELRLGREKKGKEKFQYKQLRI